MARRLTLVFDTDGTLLDARAAIVDAVAEGLAETYRHFGLPQPPASAREHIAGAIGLPATAYFRAACPPGTVPAELLDRFLAEFEVRSTRCEVAALRRGGTRLFPGVEATLAALGERGHALCLMSNAGAAYFDAVVAAHGLARWFRRTLSLEEAARRRLARDKAGMVRHLLADERPGGGEPSGVVVGDRAHDVDAGRAAGALTVGCTWGFAAVGELQGADWSIDALPDLLQLPFAAPGGAGREVVAPE